MELHVQSEEAANVLSISKSNISSEMTFSHRRKREREKKKGIFLLRVHIFVLASSFGAPAPAAAAAWEPSVALVYGVCSVC